MEKMIKVSPKELTEKPAMIRKAAQEGLLLLVVTDEAEVRNQVAGEVCRYVAQIAGYASPQWRGRIGALWQRICDEEPFKKLTASSRASAYSSGLIFPLHGAMHCLMW